MRRLPILVALGLVLASPLVAAARPTHAVPARRASVARPGTSPLPWISDDWPRALAVAKQRHLPIFVENWAPW